MLAYGQTADAAARLPIAHVICTYQYEPCQIYHSARCSRVRFRARSPPAVDFIQFPVFRRYVGVVRGINKRADAKKAIFLREYRVTMTRKKQRGNDKQTGQVRASPCSLRSRIISRTWSFQQVRSMLARVRAMFDITRCSALTITRRTEREAGNVGRRIISRIDTANSYIYRAR